MKPVFFLLDALLIRFHLPFYWPVLKLEFLDSCWVNTAQCWPLIGSFCLAVPSLDISYGRCGWSTNMFPVKSTSGMGVFPAPPPSGQLPKITLAVSVMTLLFLSAC